MAGCSESVYGRNWADMTTDLLNLISRRLVLLPDFIRFGAVCKPWRLATLNMHKERSISCYQEPPMLLIPAEDGSKDHRRLFSIWEDKIYPYRFQIPHRRRCCGSSYGWWVFAEQDDSFNLSVTLLNPFSRTTISLPTIMTIPTQHRVYDDPEYFLHKVVLSCDPCLHPNDWVAFAIVGMIKQVAFIRSGGEGSSWTFVRNNGIYGFFPVMDVCFYQGKLYAVNGTYELLAFEFSQMRDDAAVTNINPSIKSPDPKVDEYSLGSYLVELGGELLIVRKIFLEFGDEDMDFETTVGFKVRKLSYKQQESITEAEWIDVPNLGEFSLFLGDNLSVSIHASNFPHCKPNCIYYTDDCQEKDNDVPYEADDMGIFDLATGEITRYYALEPSNRYMPPAVWISPKLGQPLQS